MQLVALSKKGDKQAYEQLYRENVGKIYALCLRLCGQRELAEDLTQEAFIKAWQKINSFKGESAFCSWMYRLTSNLVISHMRQQSQWKNVSLIEDHVNHAQDIIAVAHEKSDLEKSIKELPDQARSVLILYEYFGYQHNEISKLTGLAISTCKAHLHRARNLLRKRLTNETKAI